GCNNFCTYCVVPHVRGRERSRETSAVLADVKELVDGGCKDITLLGQNVNSYKGELDFPHLLEKAVSFDGEYWVRFMTSHPKDVSRELAEVIASHENAAKHFHLPFQAGNNRILRLMNRKYTIEEYEEKAMYIKETIKDVSLTTDVICGFPTETEKEFLQTCDAVRRIGFDMIFTFLYSPRENTVAAKMDGQIPHEEKVRRFELLSEIQNANAEKNNLSYVGKTVKVLCDGYENGIFTGRTGQNKIVNFRSEKKEELLKGSFVNVKIDTAAAYMLSGSEENEFGK
ncbi:MAG: MiaB/RimO family radical SAM methylthiotransferase, partial [Clostridia bacterium]|nr:MiaB/RimO family radical SAM methylthiotransferase [Clostridia bacterium]